MTNRPLHTLFGRTSTNTAHHPSPKTTTVSTSHFTTSHRPGQRHLPTCDILKLASHKHSLLHQTPGALTLRCQHGGTVAVHSQIRRSVAEIHLIPDSPHTGLWHTKIRITGKEGERENLPDEEKCNKFNRYYTHWAAVVQVCGALTPSTVIYNGLTIRPHQLTDKYTKI